MFEHIVLRRAERGSPVSVGQIAEALLFYQRVQLVIDRVTLLDLIRQIGTGGVLALLDRPEVSAVYCDEFLGTFTTNIGVSQYHGFAAGRLIGDAKVGTFKSKIDLLQYEIEQQAVVSSGARKFAKRFFERVPSRKFSGNHFVPGGIPAAAKQDILDIEYAKTAVRNAIAASGGGDLAQDDLNWEVIETKSGFLVFTNIDFDLVNKRRIAGDAEVSPLTVALLLSFILDARADLILAAHYGGDFFTSAASSSIIQAKCPQLLHRAKINTATIKKFSEVVLTDMPSISEAIDRGERTFDEYLALLDHASRFKSWLKSVNPDEGLLRSYMSEISKKSWVERLPAKTIRYLFTLAIDAMTPSAGQVAGFADNFLVEKLLSGWRPNHFIDKRILPFVQRAEA
jgi:hypothetical protein